MANIQIPYQVPQYIVDGEKIEAAVANRPNIQIQENLLAIKLRAESDIDNLNALLFGSAPVYDSTKTYNKGDIVQDSDGNKYISLQDNNTNHSLDDTDWWKSFKLSLGGNLIVSTNMPTSSDIEPYNTVWIVSTTKEIYYQISTNENNPNWIKVGGTGNLDNKSLLFYFLLYSSGFENVTFEAFTGEPLQLCTTTGTYDYDTETLNVNATDTIVTTNVVTEACSTFQIFVNTSVTDITVEYSIDGGNTYTEVASPYYVKLDSDTSDFRVKITFNVSGTCDGWGVLWNDLGYQAESSVKINEIYVSSGNSAGDIISLPHDKVYINDGKTLQVYLNGVLQNIGEFYEEVNNRQIKLLQDLQDGDEIRFIEYYGGIDNHVYDDVLDRIYRNTDIYDTEITTSDKTATIREYLYLDSTNGSFTITLPSNPGNGDIVKMLDVGGNLSTNNVTVDGNGKNINGSATVDLDLDNKEYKFIFVTPKDEWRLII